MTREEVKSCICTIKMLQKLAYNIHGVMDVVDADNCKKIIKALEQEPQTDEIILSKKEYRELLSDEFEHGYDKGLSDAITSLEQEPCTDVISRQAAIDCLNADFTIDGKENMETVVDYIKGAFEQIKALPSVIPQQKVGRWIMKHRTYNKVKHYTGQDKMGETHTISVLERYEVDEPYCSKCGKLAGDTSQDFCCACGAKMVEPQESEDKE